MQILVKKAEYLTPSSLKKPSCYYVAVVTLSLPTLSLSLYLSVLYLLCAFCLSQAEVLALMQ